MASSITTQETVRVPSGNTAPVNTFFNLPIDPDEFGVVLDPPNLRRIDFSALEFEEMRRALIEYIRTYFPELFNDFISSNGVIMLVELVSYLADLLSQRSDIIADEAFLPTAQTETAVSQHLELINNEFQRQTPAVVDIEVSLGSEVATTVNIPSGVRFNILGADGNPLIYELFRAPNDFTSPISIFPGSRGIIGFGIEGQFATPFVFESAGGPNQSVEVLGTTILSDPITLDVQTGAQTTRWKKVDTLEKSGPNDEVFEVRFSEDRMTVRFGDDKAGKALLAGQIGNLNYRFGGGVRGRISPKTINETRPITPEAPASAAVEVLFRNPSASNGGTNKETIQEAKVRAPKESATLGSATSGEDYAILSREFSHPVFGSVLKSVATVKTSLNANIVFTHILAAGPDDIPVLSSLGLKQALQSSLEDINVLTDEVRVVDAAIKPITFKANVIVDRSYDPSLIRDRVNVAVDEFFSQSSFDLGQPLYLSQLNDLLQSLDGVKYINIKEPVDDILQSSEGSITAPDNQVGFDELITLGDLQIKIYGDKPKT
tara:strand:+ start:26749 stop:28389 length:1641 start_codon:yes stop_codon:yes gene_type:complete